MYRRNYTNQKGEKVEMINRTVLVGRLVADPELKYTPSGIAVCKFRLAVNRPFKNEQGETQADFISCVAWRKQAENLANFMKKGNLIGIDGRIQTGSYEDQDGKRVYTTDVIADSIQFLEPRNSSQNGSDLAQNYQASSFPYGQAQNQNMGQNRANNEQFNSGPIDLNESDLPF